MSPNVLPGSSASGSDGIALTFEVTLCSIWSVPAFKLLSTISISPSGGTISTTAITEPGHNETSMLSLVSLQEAPEGNPERTPSLIARTIAASSPGSIITLE